MPLIRKKKNEYIFTGIYEKANDYDSDLIVSQNFNYF